MERADERCRSVRQRRVDLVPQCLVPSLAEVQRLNRAGVPSSGRRRGQERPIPRGERVISRRAIAQGCRMFSAALYARVRNLLPIAHETAGAARIRHSLLPHLRGTTTCKARANRAARMRTCIWCLRLNPKCIHVIASAAKQSIYQPARCEMDCFAEPVIGRAFARPVGSQ